MSFTTRRVGDIARAAYASVAALLQGDRPGSEVMARDVAATCDDIDEALWAIAIFTLERIDATSAQRDRGHAIDVTRAAAEMIAFAESIAPSPLTVRAAAVRLDALRSGDLHTFAAATAGLAETVTGHDLVLGSLALLTATLRAGATQSARRPEDVCRELCTAAMLAASD